MAQQRSGLSSAVPAGLDSKILVSHTLQSPYAVPTRFPSLNIWSNSTIGNDIVTKAAIDLSRLENAILEQLYPLLGGLIVRRGAQQVVGLHDNLERIA